MSNLIKFCKVKILFINPSLRGGKAGHLFLPIGLGYVMTYVKQHGYNFDLLDIDAGSYDDEYVEKYFIKKWIACLLTQECCLLMILF